MLWLNDFDFFNVAKTLIIAAVIVLITVIIFDYIWLKSAKVAIPVSFGKFEYQFPKRMGYLRRIIILLIDFNHSRYWVAQIGCEGHLTSVLLSDGAARHDDCCFSVLVRVLNCLYYILFGRK